MTKDRGFNKLKGVTIEKINAKAINEVTLFDGDGNFYVIGSELGPLNIPVLTLTKYKEQKYKLPDVRRRVSKKPKPVMAAWPYPPEDKKLPPAKKPKKD